MPWTEVYFYAANGTAPVVDWLRALRRASPSAYAKCVAAVERLRDAGHELRRPQVATLIEGLHELRIKQGRVNYRILYFFCGRNQAVLLHALTKTDVVPRADIHRALARRRAFLEAPTQHIHEEDTRE